MQLTATQKLILHSLGHFYQSINQPLIEKPLKLQTSKIAFIELLLRSRILSKQERAVYKNLETLEKKRMIEYERRMIRFTERGLKHLNQINKEIKPFIEVEKYFLSAKPSRKMQTVINQEF